MEEDKWHKRVDLKERSYSGIVKKILKDFLISLGFESAKLGEFEIIVSELISNANKYAGEKCFFLYRKIKNGNGPGIELIYIDNGPGMKEPLAMIKDGRTTSGSFGEGLGAIFRLSDFFDMYSKLGTGTVILIKKYIKSDSKSFSVIQNKSVGMISVTAPGEQVCGDNWHLIKSQKRIYFMIADGLGHGINAHEASNKAEAVFKKNFMLPIDVQLKNMHRELKKTRGAVCMLGFADNENNRFNFCGIGNIAAKVVSKSRSSNCISYNGIVGYVIPNSFCPSSLNWNDQEIFIGHSDGINTRWNIRDYPGIERHHPTILAAVLFQNHFRMNDDALIIVIKRDKNQNYPFNFML